MTQAGETVSHHFFRRTARRAARGYARNDKARRDAGVPGFTGRYEVEKARRGPFLWVVVRYPQ